MREALEMMLFKTELSENIKNMLKSDGITNVEDFNHQMVITRSLIAKAEAGDVQAYNTICSMIGEKPADKLDIGGVPTNLTIKMVGDGGDIFPSREDDIDMEKVDYSEHDGE
jgi:predicted transcriptional regulator